MKIVTKASQKENRTKRSLFDQVIAFFYYYSIIFLLKTIDEEKNQPNDEKIE